MAQTPDAKVHRLALDRNLFCTCFEPSGTSKAREHNGMRKFVWSEGK